jgi:serine protease Do
MSKKILVTTSSVLIIALMLAGCSPKAAASQSAAVATASPVETVNIIENITTTELQDSYQQIYETVNPSVVDIRVVQEVSSQQDSGYQMPGIPGFPQFNTPQEATPSQVEGTGFIFDTDGHIITNNHVVTGAARIIVTFNDGTEAEATLVGADSGTDLAVIKVDVDPALLKPVTMADSTQLKVGQITVAIGSPFQLQGTMTTGIVSALGRTIEDSSSTSSSVSYSIPDIIQTDAAINPGNSGGPLLDLNGEVIGVNTAIESTSDSNAGIGYAIPSAIVKLVAAELIKSGSFEHTYLGISSSVMNSDIAKEMGLDANTDGILVTSVAKGSPAYDAGLKGYTDEVTIDGVTYYVGGDIITSIDGNPINGYNDLISYLLLHTSVGQKVTFEVLRDGKAIEVSATLSARPAGD